MAMEPAKTCNPLRAFSEFGGKYCGEILELLSTHGGVMRFNELRRTLGSIPSKTLSATLKKMEEQRLLLRTEFPQIPPKVEYSLLPKGADLVPVIHALQDWFARYCSEDESV